MTIEQLTELLADIAEDFGWHIHLGTAGDDIRGLVIGELQYIFSLVGDECETWSPKKPEEPTTH